MKLSKNKAEAQKAFHALMATDEPEERGKSPTFASLADEFLVHSKSENAEQTFATHRYFLQSFCDSVKGRKAPDIRPEHVTAWQKANPSWGKSTRALATQMVKAVFNRGVLNGKIASSPITKLKYGSFAHRERILTQEEREKIRGRVSGNFKDFVFALEQTGAWPYSEVGKITADMIDWEDASITFKEHKTAKYGKTRKIYLTPEMITLLKRLAEKYQTGRLFRTRSGLARSSNGCARRLRVFDKELDIKDMLIYYCRHSFATDCLAKGVSADIVAELMGNRPAVIRKYYSHLQHKMDAMKLAAIFAVSGGTADAQR